MKGILEACSNDEPFEDYDDAYDALNEFPLHIENKASFSLKILLSWGGPSDYLKVRYDPRDKEIIRVEYHFEDWFDHAEIIVDKDTYMFEYAQQMLEMIP